MGTGKSTFVSNLTGIRGVVSNEAMSATRQVTLHSSDTIHAFDVPGTEDSMQETLRLLYDMTTSLNKISIAGIFIVLKSVSYRIDMGLLSRVLLIASLVQNKNVEEMQ